MLGSSRAGSTAWILFIDKNRGSGAPQVWFECGEISTRTTCELDTSAKVLPSGLGNVEVIFDKSSNATGCSEGGSTSGHLEATIPIAHPTGVEAIRAYEGPGEWRQGGLALTESVGTKWSGTLKLADTKAGLTVSCHATGEGTVGPEAAGTETNWKTSECSTTAGECGSPSMTTKNAPWNTEMERVGTLTQDLTVSGKGGTPGFSIFCFGVIRDTCEGEFAAAMENVTGGVHATFDGGKLDCSLGGSGTGVATDTGTTIEATKGGKLEVK